MTLRFPALATGRAPRFASLLLLFAFAGCKESSTAPSAAAEQKSLPADGAPAKDKPTIPVLATQAGEMVQVPAAGAKLSPAAEKSQIPPGAYICDMGIVHYARGDEGDGKCPVCGMKLIKHDNATP